MSENDTTGPHEIPGMPPCICSRCSARRAGKAAYDAELADYQRRLAEAMLDGGHKPMVLPDTPVYGVTGPALSAGGPGGFVRVTEVSPGVWRPDPAGTASVWTPAPVIDEPAAVMIPASPMPDCICSCPQDQRWGAHLVNCPARRRLIAIQAADAAAARGYVRQGWAPDPDEPPEDPVEAWWRVTRSLGRGLTYRQLTARVPDQPPGMCATCRLMPAAPGRSWCEDCIEVTGGTPGHEPEAGLVMISALSGTSRGKATLRAAQAKAPRRRDQPGVGTRTLAVLVVLGSACVVLAMAGFTPLIIPGIVLLGASLTMILKGEWK